MMAAPADFHVQAFFNHFQVFIKLATKRRQPALVHRVQVKLSVIVGVQKCSVLVWENEYLMLVKRARAGRCFQKAPVNTSL